MTELTNDGRLAAEKAIYSKLVEMLLADGMFISVSDGGDVTVRRSRDLTEIVNAMRTTDSDTLIVAKGEADKRFGSVYLVYGNEPEEVVNDHSTSLEILMNHHGRWADRFVDAGYRDPDAPAEPGPAAAKAEPTREKLEMLAWGYVGMMEDYSDGREITDPDHHWHAEWVEARTILDGVSPLVPRSFTVELRRQEEATAQVVVTAKDEDEAEALAKNKVADMPELWGAVVFRSAYVDRVKVNRDEGACPLPTP